MCLAQIPEEPGLADQSHFHRLMKKYKKQTTRKIIAFSY
jgi:hypothetical protein